MAQAAGPSRATVATLITSMLVFGCSNSLLSKYQDMQCVADCGTAHPKHYEQPIFQTLTMFAGETLCLIALIAIKQTARRRGSNKATVESSEAAASSSSGVAVRNNRVAALSGRNKYDKLPVDDSGVVLHDSRLEIAQGSHSGQADYDHETHFHAHKSVVGPDELVPGVEDPVEPDTEQLTGFRNLLMWMPAIFDICGTTLMNVGLLWVPVSVYQMLRGALVLWVGLFSVMFLHRRLPLAQWISLLVVMLGVAVVGLSNSISGGKSKGEEANIDMGKAVIGALLVLFAQVFTASQFVIEEKIMNRYSVEPLKAVGLEGIFGVLTTTLLMPILFFTVGHSPSARGGYFDIPNGFSETINNSTVLLLSVLIAFSIAFFNFAGLAVTKSVSATARSLIDTCRTVGIWAVSLFLGWEHLALLQVVGFGLLVYGTLCFNEVLQLPSFLGGSGANDGSKLGYSQVEVDEGHEVEAATSRSGVQYGATGRRGDALDDATKYTGVDAAAIAAAGDSGYADADERTPLVKKT